MAAVTANEGSSIAKPADPVRADYAFSGCQRLTRVSLPLAVGIGGSAFANASSLAKTLTIILGAATPTVGEDMFWQNYVVVVVQVPSGAAGYGPIPATYSGEDNSKNWGAAFRGIGWDRVTSSYGSGPVRSYITLHIQYEP